MLQPCSRTKLAWEGRSVPLAHLLRQLCLNLRSTWDVVHFCLLGKVCIIHTRPHAELLHLWRYTEPSVHDYSSRKGGQGGLLPAQTNASKAALTSWTALVAD